ncbi:MAG: hypothetical protein BM563_09565 [Bacteroidetes bacterium MedPE-SWsnd-G1]|nr:MAG: hypothetical protein BM563_09565 [Bacteroidetes bacterium MedPE-SWsnd-G1]
MHYKNLIAITCVLITLLSCSSASEVCEATYFGGQIVNPRQKFVTLTKNEVAIDTFYLDKDNTFLAEIIVDKEGLYGFKHAIEFQYVYIEPKDSLLIRLNTWDFDESLVFSGRGSEKNNFLISLYLQNEKDEHMFGPYYKLESKQFEEKVAQAESLNNFLYEQLKESGVPISKKFDELAQVAINYPLYLRKEKYSWKFDNPHKVEDKLALSNTYFDYRNKVDLNNEDLASYSPFYNYVNNYLYGLALTDSENRRITLKNRLDVIIEHISFEPTRDMLMYHALYNDFRRSSQSCSVDPVGLEIFMENCTDKEYIDKVNILIDDCNKITHNTSLDNFEIADTKNNVLNINKLIKNKESVVYFWSPEIISPNMLIKRVKYLEKEFPNIHFIGINLNPSPYSNVVDHKIGNQYYLTKSSTAHNFVKSSEPRTILIDKRGVVSNSFTYLSSPYLAKQIKKLNSQ